MFLKLQISFQNDSLPVQRKLAVFFPPLSPPKCEMFVSLMTNKQVLLNYVFIADDRMRFVPYVCNSFQGLENGEKG